MITRPLQFKRYSTRLSKTGGSLLHLPIHSLKDLTDKLTLIYSIFPKSNTADNITNILRCDSAVNPTNSIDCRNRLNSYLSSDPLQQ